MRTTAMIQPKRSGVLQSTLFLVLSAETVLFGTLVMTYLFLRGGGSNAVFSHPKPLDLMIAGLNTFILLVSAVFAHSAQHAIAEDRVERLKRNLMLTLALGIIFIVGQIFEFNHAGMRINDTAFGGVFFALIGFHVLHVLAGMIVLAINFARAHLGDFRADRYMAVTAGTWFWYFVAAIWLVLFTVLYVV